MPSLIITPNRTEVSRSFPVLGFTVRIAKTPAWFEVVLATDPALFRPDARGRRTPSTFFSTRALGALPAGRDEAVFLVPAAVLDRFAGQERLYYAAASSEKADLSDADLALAPLQASPSVYVSRSLQVASRRFTLRPNPRGGLTGKGDSYLTGGDSLTWAGDEPVPGRTEPFAARAATGQAPAAASKASPAVGGSPPVATQTAVLDRMDTAYDDGFPNPVATAPAGDALRGATSPAAESADDDSSHDIGGPVPEGASTGMIAAQSLDAPGPEYPGASRFEPAAPGNYRVVPADRPRPIEKVVIHITDGGPQIGGTISWFKNPSAQVSAHYVVGRDGEVVQMVADKDVAWHAGPANRDSIGVEHVAHSGTMYPTEQEYCASAALVKWICQHHDIPLDRQHVLGHREADSSTTHTGCPDAAWDWDHYWSLATGPDCLPAAATATSLAGDIFYHVELVPQPDKLSCWAASMAMLVGFARRLSVPAETLAQEVGRSLRTSYGWDMLEAVKDHLGITAIRLPSNASLYPSPDQWYQWLDTYGPLWVTTVGAPSHAIVVRGISGDMTPAGTTLSILNPWDLSTNFDNDEIDFHPANRGMEYSQSFQDFAADFGRLGLDDYGSWRVLYLPSHVTRVEPGAGTAQPAAAGSTPSQPAAQSLAGAAVAQPEAKTVKGGKKVATAMAGVLVPVATTIAGAVMNQLVKSDGSVTWTLMQLDGVKRPHDDRAQEGSSQWTQHKITVAGPRLASPAGLKQGADFEVRWETNGSSVGNIAVSNVGVDDWLLGTLHVDARIRDEAQVYTNQDRTGQIAAVHVLFDYNFHRRLQNDYSCLTTLTLFGDGDSSEEYDWWRQAA